MGIEDEGWREWGAADARAWIAVPGQADDKYTRGVLGMVTGSDHYPGAAVLGVEAAMRTGVGMVRYLGASHPQALVLGRRPEVVTAAGRVQAWLLGSGMDPASRSAEEAQRIAEALANGTPMVIDAGALDGLEAATGAVVITPHYRELSSVLRARGTEVTADEIAAHPAVWAVRAAESLGVTVLLKGYTTHVAEPGGVRLRVTAGTTWLATAGSGDVLAGILGALVATHAKAIGEDAAALAPLAATAAVLHGLAAVRASAGGPIAALDIAEALPATIAALLG
ncbi:MAG: ADP-dependent NAD(P)H-hydrate dehydratase / NAD(P)H-hydrate epimerase [Microbacteriaceae bacterium]|nr:ADP-dependent NAD(P)H-hydrate dehydratase / NAD(P)H-hydrate epimerase [Microbacteriaceae bacterium]